MGLQYVNKLLEKHLAHEFYRAPKTVLERHRRFNVVINVFLTITQHSCEGRVANGLISSVTYFLGECYLCIDTPWHLYKTFVLLPGSVNYSLNSHTAYLISNSQKSSPG